MATVTVVTAERTLEIEATSIVSGTVNAAGHLILTRQDGTPIDVGAVSGMQLDGGATYSKVDAFTYVGDTDPGAVADGSVWLDTNLPAGPFASETQQGLVELATNAETQTGTDTARAVTPASLASIPGTKVQIVSGIAEASLSNAYPVGVSLMDVSTWSLNGGFGHVVTNNINEFRCQQTFYSSSGGTATLAIWMRHQNTANGGGGWTAWHQLETRRDLNPAGFAQTTVFTAYPAGWSRIYFSAANSTGWDFAGNYGEVMTFVDGVDFAKQIWTLHTNGGGGPAEMWIRTANGAGGWSAWRKFITDPGPWSLWTPSWVTSSGVNTPALGNATVDCRYIKYGRLVTAKFDITFGSTTNFGAAPGGSDNWRFGLPVAAARTGDSLGFIEQSLAGDINMVLAGRARSTSATTFAITIGSGPAGGTAVPGGDADSISPWTWTSGSSVKGTLTYESAT